VTFVKAVRDIEPDEEITISYVNSLLDRKSRQEALKELYDFDYSCSSCKLEAEGFDSFAKFREMSSPEALMGPSLPASFEDFIKRATQLLDNIDSVTPLPGATLNADLVVALSQLLTLLIELDTIFELTKPKLESQVHPLFDRTADKLMHHLLKTKH